MPLPVCASRIGKHGCISTPCTRGFRGGGGGQVSRINIHGCSSTTSKGARTMVGIAAPSKRQAGAGGVGDRFSHGVGIAPDRSSSFRKDEEKRCGQGTWQTVVQGRWQREKGALT
jgi:hypothetical protein